jgi:ParB-like chromosome segregation protein Spo0J
MNVAGHEPISQLVSPNDVTLHAEASRIPEMSPDEWADFLTNVRDRMEILEDIQATRAGVVFDGRHRLRAALECGIKLIPVKFHDITNEEAIRRMGESAVNRRHLTDGQRAAVVLEFTELVDRIREEAKERQREAAEATNTLRRGDDDSDTLVEDLPEAKKGLTRDALGERAGVSGKFIQNLMAVQRDEPDLFAKVKSGEITVNKAYTETKKRKLPPQCPATDAPPLPEPKIERLRTRKKPPEVAVRPDESAISANNRTIKYTKEQLTPFIEGFLMQYYTASRADDEARAPFIEETRVLFEACARMLIEFSGDKLFETMEGIRNGNETEDET